MRSLNYVTGKFGNQSVVTYAKNPNVVEPPYICCPTCRQTFRLDVYTIASGGLVTPGVTCPTLGCGDSYTATLVGWP